MWFAEVSPLAEFSKINYNRVGLDTLAKKIRETGSNDLRHDWEWQTDARAYCSEHDHCAWTGYAYWARKARNKHIVQHARYPKRRVWHSVQIIHRDLGLKCLYCPRGSDGLHCVRPSFLFSVTTISHEPLHLACCNFALTHVPWQLLQPYYISRSSVNGQGHMGFGVSFCVPDTRGQYLVSIKAILILFILEKVCCLLLLVFLHLISQGSVATQLRCGGIFNNHVIANLLLS